MRVVHVISGLDVGGAEMMLLRLLAANKSSRAQAEVISLTCIGRVGERMVSLGVPVRALNMRRGRPGIFGVVTLARWLRRVPADVVQTWMYHGDLVGGLAARLSRRTPVVWGIRNGMLDRGGSKRTTVWTAKLCAVLSRAVPRSIVVNSQRARLFHEAMGYCGAKMVTIPNGFDLAAFKPCADAHASLTEELGIPERTVLIGLVARLDPQKDHENFFRAAELLALRHCDVHFVMCGAGVDRANTQLVARSWQPPLKSRIHLLGRRDDIPRITAALDIATCSSYAEAFPNVLGEAMACEVPCATTDAGDAAMIVGPCGIVVPVRDPESLASAWSKLLALGPDGRRALGRAGRERIQAQFDIRVIAQTYMRLYQQIHPAVPV